MTQIRPPASGGASTDGGRLRWSTPHFAQLLGNVDRCRPVTGTQALTRQMFSPVERSR
jgi:hypothetical protein